MRWIARLVLVLLRYGLPILPLTSLVPKRAWIAILALWFVAEILDSRLKLQLDEERLDRESGKPAEILSWREKLMEATSYDQWIAAAVKLDSLEGGDAWKEDPRSSLYDVRHIEDRLKGMEKAYKDGDLQQIMLLIRNGLIRHLGGIGNPQLFAQTRYGTKNLIHQHQEALSKLLWVVAKAPDSVLSIDQRLSFCAESRHSLGKTALLLSGGAGLGMYHFGVIKALWKQNLLPRVMSGSSAGSIVVGIIGTMDTRELDALFAADEEEALQTRFSDEKLEFFGQGNPLKGENLRRLFATGSLMDVEQLKKILRLNMGDMTFHEAYEKTGRIINITVSPGSRYETPRLLNYLTAPDIVIWSASCASCALPGLFPGVELVRKDAGGRVLPYFTKPIVWTDGSLHSDLPTAKLQELFNVNYFIVSQTNPHALPFFSQFFTSHRSRHQRSDADPASLSLRALRCIWYMISSEFTHRCSQAINVGILPVSFGRLFHQKYEGDVTILPPITSRTFRQALANPSIASLRQFILTAERRTWPTIGLIRSQCQIETTLDECVRHLAQEAQTRVLAEKSNRGQASQELRGNMKKKRHTHLDLSSYFGTSTIKNNSHLDFSLAFSRQSSLGSGASAADLQSSQPARATSNGASPLSSPLMIPSSPASRPVSLSRDCSKAPPFSPPISPELHETRHASGPLQTSPRTSYASPPCSNPLPLTSSPTSTASTPPPSSPIVLALDPPQQQQQRNFPPPWQIGAPSSASSSSLLRLRSRSYGTSLRSLTEKDSEREGGAKGEERISSGEGVRIGGESKEMQEATCCDDVQGEKNVEGKGGEVEEGRRGSSGSDVYEEEKEEDEVFGWGPSTDDGFLHPIRSSIDQDRPCAESRSFDSEADASMTRSRSWLLFNQGGGGYLECEDIHPKADFPIRRQSLGNGCEVDLSEFTLSRAASCVT